MTDRKPPGADWQSWVDAVIGEGRERGDFDNLPGSGKPIEGLDGPHDELWWVPKKLKEEGLSYLPPTLALRKDKEDTLAAIATLGSEAHVRRRLAELNERIRAVNRRPTEGPPSSVMPIDIEATVAGWRSRRAASSADAAAPRSDPPPARSGARTAGDEPAPRRWLRRHRRGTSRPSGR